MSHHSSDPKIPESLRRLLAGEPQCGATGRYPAGRLNEHDEGEIQIAFAADHERGVVVVDFGKPTAWIGFTAAQAVEIADTLIAKAHELRGITK